VDYKRDQDISQIKVLFFFSLLIAYLYLDVFSLKDNYIFYKMMLIKV
jgi:hypothetical protein